MFKYFSDMPKQNGLIFFQLSQALFVWGVELLVLITLTRLIVRFW